MRQTMIEILVMTVAQLSWGTNLPSPAIARKDAAEIQLLTS